MHVWTVASSGETPNAPGISVHRDLGAIGISDLTRVGRSLSGFERPRRVLVQWVPHAFGYHAMNIAFCLWLWWRSMFRGDVVELMVHEAYLDFDGSWRQRAAALLQRVMSIVLLQATSKVWVAIPAWRTRLERFTLGRKLCFRELAIPSVLPIAPSGAGEVSSPQCNGLVVGHYGSFNQFACDTISQLLPELMTRFPSLRLVLIGWGGGQFRACLTERFPQWRKRIVATGLVRPDELSRWIQACDVMLQPYSDGVTARRTTVMAALAHGKAVTTTIGHHSEEFWIEEGGVQWALTGDSVGLARSLSALLGDAAMRADLGRRGQALYEQRFDLRHTIGQLCDSGGIA